MNLVYFFPLFVLIEMEIHAKRTKTPPNVISIPLTRTTTKLKTNHSGGARSAAIFLDDYTPLNAGTITVGTEPGRKNYKVIFDTGSPHLVLYSNLYSTCESNTRNVRAHTLFDSSASSTISYPADNTPELLIYGSLWVFGTWCNDIVKILDNLVRQDILEVTMISDKMAQSDYDGILGLTYDPDRGNIVTKICEKIKGENKFSVYFPRYKNARPGEVWLCGEDESKYVAGTMNYVSESHPGIWMIKVDKAEMEAEEQGITVASLQFWIKIDTATNRINAPSFIIDKIYTFLGAKPFETSSTAKQVDCNNVQNLPNLTLSIDGRGYSFTAEEYIQRVPTAFGERCVLLFRKKTQAGSYWTIGDIFIRKYYTVFDMKNHRIGFATSKG